MRQRSRAFFAAHIIDIAVILLAICAEVFVFNMPFWRMMTSTPTHIAQGQVTLGPGLKAQGHAAAKVTDANQAWIEITSDAPVEYLRVNPPAGHIAGDAESGVAAADNTTDVVTWTMDAKQKAAGGLRSNPDSVKQYSPWYEDSQYIRIGGGMNTIRFHYQTHNGATVALNSFTVNPRMPFSLAPVRVCLELLAALFLIAFRPGSRLYRYRFSLRDRRCAMGLTAVFLLQIAIVIVIWLLFGGNHAVPMLRPAPAGDYYDPGLYNQMADALIHGHVSLDFPVNPDLAAMANPYDTLSRQQIAAHTHSGVPIPVDVAFKNGKYYSYFGVLPALVLFAPYKLLTGMNLELGVAVLVLALLVVASSMLLLVQLTRLIARRIGAPSLGSVLLVASTMMLGYPLFIDMKKIIIHQLPQTMGITLIMLALSCWMESTMRGLSRRWLAAGALCMGLVVSCRPQMAFAAIIAIALFWGDIVRLWRNGRSSRQAIRTELAVWAAALLPFIAAVIPALLYNKARFGSLLDFGAKYNLTNFDMAHQAFPWTHVFTYVWLYLAQPPNVQTEFPFIDQTVQPMPVWLLPQTFSYGGLFVALAPFACVLFAAIAWRGSLKRAHMNALFMTVLLYAVAVLVANAHIAGYDVRYTLDFGWAVMLMLAMYLLTADACRPREPTGMVRPADRDPQGFLMRGIPGAGTSEVRISEAGAARTLPQALPAMSDISRIMTVFVVIGALCAYAFLFFSLFRTDPPVFNAWLWWDVRSWFLFI
ncbi:hypothetical protein [Bifidobacterium tibiigranuli]|jgi:hypothetical protein|uniref:hypothetical protein n=1 Tax=Bifidobacterium tibiigranuli TaxID=2172043 RepID=UPI0026EA7220|nr:hypothetical protein [Bifidobacterium tibiigranuli]MCI1649921.1 hypothetical protein [Bifidobacterium tibiigranuli]MCI2185244.1 hypothetical protein [Bifidobacterium tibiigranuli]MCI2203191.1 hypothetical protein [Bifidobacterium tibiigranuli]